MLHALALFVIGAAAFIGSLFGVHPASQQDLGTALPSGTAVFETSLASRISSTDTSMTLVANSVRGGTTLSGYQCFTVDEGRTDAEYICGTISGTSVTSLVRGVDPQTATTSNSTLKFAHRVGANVKITDFPVLQILRNQANGAEMFPNPLLYQSHPCSASSASNTICDQRYVEDYANNVIAGGAATSTESLGGKVELGTLAEQASSFDGGVAKPTVLQTKNSTSSCQVVGSYNVVASSTTGKIDRGCIDQTSKYNLTGDLTFASTTTTNASSTSLAITGSALHVNGINYRFPSTQGASSSGLGTDGSGNLSWNADKVVVLYNSYSVLSSSNTSSTTLLTVAIPANTISTTATLEGFAFFTQNAAGGNVCNYDMYFGTGAATTSIVALQAANNASYSRVFFNMFATSTAAEVFNVMGNSDTSGNSDVLTASAQMLTKFAPHALTAKTYFAFESRVSAGSATCALSGATLKVISQ